jgi:hypothetical protein
MVGEPSLPPRHFPDSLPGQGGDEVFQEQFFFDLAALMNYLLFVLRSKIQRDPISFSFPF